MATQLTVEDMLEKSKGLPSEVRRSMDLLRILDTRWMSHRHTADQLQRAYISDMRGRLEGLPRDGSVDLRKISEDSDALAKVMSTQQDLIQISEEKCSVARQVYESVSCALEKMAVDLKRFEVELKVNGDWKEEVRFFCGGTLELFLVGSVCARNPLNCLLLPPPLPTF